MKIPEYKNRGKLREAIQDTLSGKHEKIEKKKKKELLAILVSLVVVYLFLL